MYSFTAYGLELECNVPIPGLREAPKGKAVDVRVTLGVIPAEFTTARLSCEATKHFASPDRDENGLPALEVHRLQGGRYFHFEYPDKTVFVIDAAGSRIWATWSDASTVEDTATYLLGPVLGFVLRLRGITCLHASAVAIQGQAVAFVGPAGAGKSSIAAAFSQHGHSVLSDDVVALTDLGHGFLVQPAYPRVRLWPASVKGLFGAPDALPRLTPTWDKLFLQLSEPLGFQDTPLRLAAIYMLGERRGREARASIEPMPQRTALIDLVSNTYTTYLLNSSQRAQEFELLGRLLEYVPIHTVRAGADLENMTPTCETIVEHFLNLRSRATGASQMQKACAS
jgi:hypothetical protein